MDNLNSRQIKICQFVRENNSVNNKQVREFLISLGEEVTRMTIIRDLDKLLVHGFVTRKGEGRSVKYQITHKALLLCPIDLEKYFQQDFVKRHLISNTFNFDVFKYLQEQLFSDKEVKQITELNKKEYLAKVKNISDGILRKETERLLIEFSWKSSQIEGNTYSVLETETLIKENIEAKGHSREESLMILGHRDAFEYVWQNKANFQKISVAKIEDIHKLLIKELDIAQNIRKRLVGIGGTKYLPLDNEFQIREALEKTCAFINNSKISPIVKATMAVLLISYIQPFEDGNKRTARMIGNAILIANDFCPLSYRAVEVTEYKKASLLFYEINSISYFKKIFIEQFEDAVKNYFN